MTEVQRQPGLIVLGDDLTQLAVALEVASVGVAVTVIASRDTPGALPVGPQSDPNGALSSWITEVGTPLTGDGDPACSAVRRDPLPVWVRHGASWVALPADSVFGIPSSPLSVEVSEALGSGAAFRAYLDRVKPVLTIGKTQYVADLVRKRVGRKVLDTFVEPQVRHLFGEASTVVEVADLAPGLNEAETRTGSLTGAALAYLERYPALAAGTEPDVGWAAFVELVKRRLDHYDVRWIEPDHPTATPINAADTGLPHTWQVRNGGSALNAPMLARASEPKPAQPVRHEIVVRHTLPAWWPAPEGEAAAAVQVVDIEVARGLSVWSARTVADGGAVFTELRSPAVEAAELGDPPALEELLAAFGLAGLDAEVVRTSTRFAGHGQQSVTVLEETNEPAPIECAQGAGERGLARSIADARAQAKEQRREALGLV